MAEHAFHFQRKNAVDSIALSPLIPSSLPCSLKPGLYVFFHLELEQVLCSLLTSLAWSDAVTNISANFCSTLLPRACKRSHVVRSSTCQCHSCWSLQNAPLEGWVFAITCPLNPDVVTPQIQFVYLSSAPSHSGLPSGITSR